MVMVFEGLLYDVKEYISRTYTGDSISSELLPDNGFFQIVTEPAINSYRNQKTATQKTGMINITESIILQLDEPFASMLMQLIDQKGKNDVDVYKRANIDRKLFSKIRTARDYMPSKRTVIALAVALELTLPETQELLRKAGFTLSRSVMFDVIVEYFIENRMYNIFEINNILLIYNQQLL